MVNNSYGVSATIINKQLVQRVFVVELNNYVYYVPFVKAGDDLFLKTIIPSRKLTKEYLRQGGG